MSQIRPKSSEKGTEIEAGAYNFAELLERAKAHDRSISHPVLTFGMDLQVLALAEEHIGPSRTRKVFYRPALEPLLLSCWSELADLDFDIVRASEIVSLLTGQAQGFRSNRVIGRAPDGGTFAFNQVPDNDWLAKLKFRDEAIKCPIKAAASRYYKIIWEHPFADGNGRFARALLIGALAKWGVIDKPSLGLSGSMEYLAGDFAASFVDAHKKRRLETLSQTIAKSINLSLMLIEHYQAGMLVYDK